MDVLELMKSLQGQVVRGQPTDQPCALSHRVIRNGEARLVVGDKTVLVSEALDDTRRWLMQQGFVDRQAALDIRNIQDLRQCCIVQFGRDNLTDQQRDFLQKRVIMLGGQDVLTMI